MHDSAEINWSWLAGFFDGEGCVAVYTRACSLTIGQKDRRVLDKVKAVAGGKVTGPYGVGRRSDNDQGHYIWQVSTLQETKYILERMWPYLSDAKKEDADRKFAVREVARSEKNIDPANRGRRHLDLDMNEVEHLYVKELMSTIEIADKFNIHPSTIARRLKAIGVETRNNGGSRALRCI